MPGGSGDFHDVPRRDYRFVKKQLIYICPVGATHNYKSYLMANTYTQLYIHFVFAVKNRAALLNPEWDQRLRSYINAIVQNNKHKMLAINNMPDHLHLFAGLHPSQSISELMQLVKGDSSEWINKTGLTPFNFNGRKVTGRLAIPTPK